MRVYGAPVSAASIVRVVRDPSSARSDRDRPAPRKCATPL